MKLTGPIHVVQELNKRGSRKEKTENHHPRNERHGTAELKEPPRARTMNEKLSRHIMKFQSTEIRS